jgi:hypothetical protein
MNKNNRSGHPVLMPNNQRPLVGDGAGMSYEPRGLHDTQLQFPWNAAPGTNAMYCSDCHGSDEEGTPGAVKGPHGSILDYLLKGEHNHWPYKADGVTLWTMDDLIAAADGDGTATDGLFCKNCHEPSTPHTYWRNNMSGGGYTCVTCHVVIPHGSPVSRLIGYRTFKAPYNFGGNSLQLEGWAKRKYKPDDQGMRTAAYASTNCGGRNGCHKNDNSSTIVYDGVEIFTNGYDTAPIP